MVTRAARSREELFGILDTVKDPEVPVVSVVELGIVRDIVMDDDMVVVRITPTYSGCPAMREIEQDIASALERRGVGPVRIETVYAPPWTTDWIGAAAREKLRAAGIAPPGPAEDAGLVTLTRGAKRLRCPWCGSSDTELRSEFGSTACKAIHFCNACRQPFDEFKAF
jgi:ring-1,2-phenylacetyl-CoA epoxidase subunit PaaD